LTPREERVGDAAHCRFGIALNTDHRWKEVKRVGRQQFSVTRERIRRFEAKATAQLSIRSAASKLPVVPGSSNDGLVSNFSAGLLHQQRRDGEDYNGFHITPQPIKDGQGLAHRGEDYRTDEGHGEDGTRLIRADYAAKQDEASAASLRKGKADVGRTKG